MDESHSGHGSGSANIQAKKDDSSGAEILSDGAQQQILSGEIPFLVTHWLSNYEKSNSSGSQDNSEKIAMAKIRSAASEIASAFASLGAYGTTLRVSSVAMCCIFIHFLSMASVWSYTFFPTHTYSLLWNCPRRH